ncbi:MAG: hypothetical protein LBP59_04255 [Planctomycetaceae bacterium]|jgi:hypothetical protein|nr:hypothetical protein [Planctomycetaceae bacterium]
MSEIKISTDFWFAYRQSAGETPAIRRSRLLFKIAGVSPAILLDFSLQKIVPLVPLVPHVPLVPKNLVMTTY